jgi:cytidine deaminase
MDRKEQLISEAKSVMKYSYSPYSHFRVGAAIRDEDGTIFTGTNIENAAYSLTVCAERVAIFNAISKGHRSFTDLAITTSSGLPTPPCGPCRQVLYEFNPEMKIHLEGRNNKEEVFRLKDLLPHAFVSKQDG